MTITVRLTLAEAHALQQVVGNGWGDGDFADWLGNKRETAACVRAMTKLDVAIRAAKEA